MARLAAAALAALLALAPAAAAEEPPAPPAAPAPDDAAKRKEKKVRKFLELTRFREATLAGLDMAFGQQVRMGMLPEEFPRRFHEVADFDALEAIAAEAWGGVLDEPTLDGLIAFHETEAGRKFVAANLELMPALMKKIEPWAMENAMKAMQAMGEMQPEQEEDETGIPANEMAAIATLRNLCSCQAQIQTSGKIDCDRDGIGEHATFLELTGSAGVRKAFQDGAGDFSSQGTKVDPPIMSAKLAGVDVSGVVRKGGYCFRIFLPDAASPSSFTHEVGPAEAIGLAGGTARVGVDMAETTWCAYAWPEKIGESGNRAFFVNQCGDVMQSANGTAKWAGERAPPGSAALLGDGISSPQAIGTRGRDGEVWKVCD